MSSSTLNRTRHKKNPENTVNQDTATYRDDIKASLDKWKNTVNQDTTTHRDEIKLNQINILRVNNIL